MIEGKYTGIEYIYFVIINKMINKIENIILILAVILILYALHDSIDQQELTALEIIVQAENTYSAIEREQCAFLLEQNGGNVYESEREAKANNLFCIYN